MYFKEGIIIEDGLWLYILAQKQARFVIVQNPTYIYKVRSNSTTTSKNSRKKVDSFLYILQLINKDILQKDKAVQQLGSNFIGFTKFNVALLLLNFSEGYSARNFYYKELQKIKTPCFNYYSFFLSITPFVLFYLLLKPIYYLYKIK